VEARSPLEVDFLALCREARLPLPGVNVLVNGRLVDFLWAKERVIVETDGYAYHRDRPAFERDHEATIALASAGYVVHRATYRMLKREPDQFMTLVRRALDSGHHV
jgi:very-short-patch-repair endonuclease